MSKALILLPGMAVFGWACLSTSNSQTAENEAPSASTLAVQQMDASRVNTSALYNETCAKCHGDRGQGGGGGTQTLLKDELMDQKLDKRFFDAIKNGVPDGGMEAYGNTMPDAVIWALVVHIRELQQRDWRGRNIKNLNGGALTTQRHSYRMESVISSGLRTPWAVDWLPDGRMLITNRPGQLTIAKDGQVIGEVEGLPPIVEIGQGGLMEVAVHPNYRQNGWIYLAFTAPSNDRPRAGFTKIVRGKLQGTRWTGQQTIFEVDQKFYSGSGLHFGSRIVFDKGMIYFAIGERGSQDFAQDLSRPNGKVYRLHEDGRVPTDNPFVNEPNAIPAIWSYGHRNPQGLVKDLEGNLWDTEHGPRGGDELNLVKKGGNYGWPLVAFSINYNDSPFRTPWPRADQKIEMPVYRWLPSIGACGLDLYRGDKFPNWRGDLLAGGLSGANVDRIRVKGGKLVEREEIFHGQGRVRDVAVGPDGFVYIALNDPDKIVRLVPVR